MSNPPSTSVLPLASLGAALAALVVPTSSAGARHIVATGTAIEQLLHKTIHRVPDEEGR